MNILGPSRLNVCPHSTQIMPQIMSTLKCVLNWIDIPTILPLFLPKSCQQCPNCIPQMTTPIVHRLMPSNPPNVYPSFYPKLFASSQFLPKFCQTKRAWLKVYPALCTTIASHLSVHHSSTKVMHQIFALSDPPMIKARFQHPARIDAKVPRNISTLILP